MQHNLKIKNKSNEMCLKTTKMNINDSKTYMLHYILFHVLLKLKIHIRL